MTTQTPEQDQTERGTLLRKAYGSATTILRENHRQEFDGLYQAEAEKLGVDYKPRPNAEQKAAQDLADLLERFPHLRASIAADDHAAPQEMPVQATPTA